MAELLAAAPPLSAAQRTKLAELLARLGKRCAARLALMAADDSHRLPAPTCGSAPRCSSRTVAGATVSWPAVAETRGITRDLAITANLPRGPIGRPRASRRAAGDAAPGRADCLAWIARRSTVVAVCARDGRPGDGDRQLMSSADANVSPAKPQLAQGD